MCIRDREFFVRIDEAHAADRVPAPLPNPGGAWEHWHGEHETVDRYPGSGDTWFGTKRYGECLDAHGLKLLANAPGVTVMRLADHQLYLASLES